MSRMVQCQKLNKLAQGLEKPPYPGPLGDKVFTSISQEAWAQWLNLQTMLINEHRLSMMDPKARAFLKVEMENFLFHGVDAKPAGFVPPSS